MDEVDFNNRMNLIDRQLAAVEYPIAFRAIRAWFTHTGETRLDMSPKDPSVGPYETTNIFATILSWYKSEIPDAVGIRVRVGSSPHIHSRIGISRPRFQSSLTPVALSMPSITSRMSQPLSARRSTSLSEPRSTPGTMRSSPKAQTLPWPGPNGIAGRTVASQANSLMPAVPTFVWPLNTT